ncbi:nuclease [Neokomagataea thailandica NBRC 106555]|uniref:Double-strand break repair protein AddB n=2 Tax=Neokomagataea TaxID=1223423 RepID=A0A4Y6V9N9_9PROT|nr:MULTISPECIES: double-strand break repair protein AddB [Neokomagataea]QDH25177.1 double-strand break repair protein AddB [Neokomagataea tanensis]GBR51917.1 nuclease [Neokomagataea thailandica NBRC 106555]
MHIVSVSPGVAFLDCVVRKWLAQESSDNAQAGPGLILVPSRRAGRALMEAFLRVLDGEAALLPRVVAMNDVDEGGLIGGEVGFEVDLPPPVDKQQRLAVLSWLILQTPIVSLGMDRTKGIDRAWPLAKALAELMDEAERAGVNLSEALPGAVDEQFSEHWRQTLQFLEIVTSIWPQWLQEQGLMNPVARQVARLKAQAALWHQRPPETPVWAVGFADGSAAVVDVLAAVARMPRGCVVLPGVDLVLEDGLWEVLPEAHPQAGLKEILDVLAVTRSELSEWGADTDDDFAQMGREAVMRDVMLPEQGIGAWGKDLEPRNIEGLYRLPAQDQQQEAQAIALILRNAVQKPGYNAALITPDRSLARRVGTELQRFGIVADDSAGMSLAESPPAVFLRLIAQAVEAQLSPVALLSMIKHPLAAMGQSPGVCRASARRLERLILRGPAPAAGIAGLRSALHAREAERLAPDEGQTADAPDWAEDPLHFVDRLEVCLAPLLAITEAAPLPELLEALVQSAEALAATEQRENDGAELSEEEGRGASRLWVGEEGEALAQHLAGLMEHTALLPPQKLGHLDSFLNTALSGETLTGARAYRDGEELAHPRVSILGVLEARLQAFNVVVLGGLNETVWPPATDSGPWLSRPMRARVGLAPPERQIGISAHDFVSAVMGGGQVVFSNAGRRDGSPGVMARWLVRMEAFLEGRKQALPVHVALEWQKKLDQPLAGVELLTSPMPRPNIALRPRQLSITDIETLKKDPYAIYAKHVLKLKPLSPLEEGVEHADFGTIVHDAMEQVLRVYPDAWPDNAERHVRRMFDEALDRVPVRPALANWWRPRLARIADWVVAQERERRLAQPGARHFVEVSAQYKFMTEQGLFTVTGRADRIDINAEGNATVFDYKTGAPPSGKDVARGWASQLVLEGAFLARGAFANVPAAETEALLYWQLSGGSEAGKETSVPSTQGSDVTAQMLIAGAIDDLRALVVAYEKPEQAYLSQPWAKRPTRYTDYELLARVAEWKAASYEDEGDDA